MRAVVGRWWTGTYVPPIPPGPRHEFTTLEGGYERHWTARLVSWCLAWLGLAGKRPTAHRERGMADD